MAKLKPAAVKIMAATASSSNSKSWQHQWLAMAASAK